MRSKLFYNFGTLEIFVWKSISNGTDISSAYGVVFWIDWQEGWDLGSVLLITFRACVKVEATVLSFWGSGGLVVLD